MNVIYWLTLMRKQLSLPEFCFLCLFAQRLTSITIIAKDQILTVEPTVISVNVKDIGAIENLSKITACEVWEIKKNIFV